jgi:hypothetical protein
MEPDAQHGQCLEQSPATIAARSALRRGAPIAITGKSIVLGPSAVATVSTAAHDRKDDAKSRPLLPANRPTSSVTFFFLFKKSYRCYFVKAPIAFTFEMIEK